MQKLEKKLKKNLCLLNQSSNYHMMQIRIGSILLFF